MVWIALVLLLFSVGLVGLNTARDRWGMWHWRHPWRRGLTYEGHLQNVEHLRRGMPWPAPAAAVQDAVLTSCRAVLEQSGFVVFSNWFVFSVFLSFLLPIWSLSFATEALGGEREGGSLVWLLTRPLPRWSIYLAKFLAMLPWALGLNLGGFWLICMAAGEPGRMAFALYWPAVLWGSLAFCSLFHLMGACFRRPAVIALVYSFFLETFLGGMPGYMKRISISFYARCMMFEKGGKFGILPPSPEVYLPVSSGTAQTVLIVLAAGLLVVGMLVFAQKEH
ncbi:MAG: hypothetical protein KatS3mg105_3233 [Gemmatales bacterium]|nr:MAG: hypothetical protein KatS3mg105_3233 [Gemmatales bacterium]